MPASRWLAPCDMGQWIDGYDRAEITADTIPAGSIRAATSATVIVASTLPRAQSSASCLGHSSVRIDAVFREAALPFPSWRFPLLPPRAWAALLRAAWLLGYDRNTESLAAARLRAKVASARLVACAADGPVLLVGHGIMNRLIAQELKAAGWAPATIHGRGYWGSVTLHSPTVKIGHGI